MTVFHTIVTGSRAASRQSTVGFAWQVHTAMESWTSRADVKASVLLALQGGAIMVVVNSQVMSAATMSSLPTLVFVSGTLLLIAAMCLAAAALTPTLGSARRHRHEYRHNFVYFGHIRMWPDDQLIRRLLKLTDDQVAAMVAAQLAVLSQLNWRKHRLLQLSIVLTMAAFLGLVVAFLIVNQLPSGGPLTTPVDG